MELKHKTIKNSFYSMMAQVIMILLRFVSRFFLIRYIGVELVGLSDTISSTVGLLSLAEAGIGVSISYSLYTPIHNDDREMINKIMNVFRRLYLVLSGIVLMAGIVVSFLLKYILKGVVLNGTVYLVYFLYVGNICLSYLLSHRRTLLYADIKEYMVKRVDIATNIIFTIIGLIVIFTVHSISLYIVTILLQTFVSNIWVHVSSKKLYPYLQKGPIDKVILKDTLSYVKDLFWGTVAGFVYNSTDNIIISSFLGTVYVGYISNYSLVSKSVQTIVAKILAPITPTIGRLERENLSRDKFIGIFKKYHQICYLSALLVSVPMLVLFDGFISYVFGRTYLLEPSIKYLLTYVLYVNIAAFAYGNILTTSGAFNLLKQVEMIGAIVNIVTSLILVIIMGIPGVLLGTAITVTVQWAIRSYMVYKNCLYLSKKAWLRSIFNEAYKIMLVAISYLCGLWLYDAFRVSFVFKFILCGCFCMMASGLIYLGLYRGNDKIAVGEIIDFLTNRGTER